VKKCKDCDGELQRRQIVGSSKRLDKEGRCPICAEVHGEAKADDDAVLERAARIQQRRSAEKAACRA